MSNRIYVKPRPAFKVLEGFLKAAEEFAPQQQVNHLSAQTNAGGLSLLSRSSQPSAVHQDPSFQRGLSLLKAQAIVELQVLDLRTPDYRLVYKEESGGPYIELLGALWDRGSFEEIAPCLRALTNNLAVVRKSELISGFLPPAQAELFNYFEETVGDFATQAARLAQLSAENTTNLSERIMAQTAAQDVAYKARVQELEDAYKKRQGEVDAKETALREKEKVMDTRENTAVRRELFEKIQKIIEEQKTINISPETVAKRIPIRNLCVLSIILSLGLIGTFGYKVFTAPSFDWHFALPVSAGMLLFVSTSVFFVRWNDQWFSEHAQAEFRNRKFKADIARASWLAELLFEWGKKRETQFPSDLVASYTTGLFKEPEGRNATKHPYDDLQDLMKTVSTVRIGKGSLELSKDGKVKTQS